jgi:hypothetical protein
MQSCRQHRPGGESERFISANEKKLAELQSVGYGIALTKLRQTDNSLEETN